MQEPIPSNQKFERERKLEGILNSKQQAMIDWGNIFFSGQFPDVSAPNDLLSHHLDQYVPQEIQQRFQGHGVTRAQNWPESLKILDDIADHSRIKGSSGPLAGPAYMNAWTNGDFLVLSQIDQQLIHDPKPGTDFCQASIGAIVLNGSLVPLIDELQKLYPQIAFLIPLEPDSNTEKGVDRARYSLRLWMEEQVKQADNNYRARIIKILKKILPWWQK